MKYIKLFEKFDSNILTSILSYLSKKFDDRSKYSSFVTYLQSMLDEYNIPISSISDDDIQYLPYNKALLVKGRRNKNRHPAFIEYLKFWFSLEHGFVGTTMVGEKRLDFGAFDNNITPDMLRWLYNRTGITGVLSPVKDFSKMKSGDEILIATTDDFDKDRRRNYKSYLAIGILYIDDRNPSDIQYYLYSDFSSADGDRPDRIVNGIERMGNDYYYSYKLTENEYSELHIVKEGREDKLVMKRSSAKESPWDFNVPLMGEWTSRDDVSNYENADFAIVLKLNDVVKKSDLEKTRDNRKEARREATAFLSNDEARQINLKRYLTTLYNRLNITSDNDFKNINSVLLSSICRNKFLLYSKNDYLTNRLGNFISSINRLLSNNREDEQYKEYLVNEIKLYYDHIRKSEQTLNTRFSTNIALAENMSVDKTVSQFLDIVNRMIKIGDYVTEYYKSYDIKTVEDIQMEYTRLKSIENIMDSNTHSISSDLNSVISAMGGSEHNFFGKLLDFIKNYDDETYQKDIKKIEHTEKYVKLILK